MTGQRYIIDPHEGDVEDDALSTKNRKLSSIAGSILAEISLPKLMMAWTLLVGLPGLLLGLAPLIISAWIIKISNKTMALSGLGSVLLFATIALVGLLGLRPLFRLAERSFWALHSLAVQPIYALIREGISQFSESLLASNSHDTLRSKRRALSSAIAGFLVLAVAGVCVTVVWPYTRWTGTLSDLAAPLRLVGPALANAVAIVSAYSGLASVAWGIADATMTQPQGLKSFEQAAVRGSEWRAAHVSDIHAVGEQFGFRIESGRAGAQGNERISRIFERLNEVHASEPIDTVVITGDMTDSGRSSEWAEFLDRLAEYPELSKRALILPGNHDVNVVDRTNPARLELPTSPLKQLRQMRVLSAMVAIQGDRAHTFDRDQRKIGSTLAVAVAPYQDTIASLANISRFQRSPELSRVWADSFPQIIPPKVDDGIGIVILNSNSQSNFSFTNALGFVPAEDTVALRHIFDQFPKAAWVVALHHHLMEYPMAVKSFSERIGTALINGSWLVRQLAPYADRLVVMHGHRHMDWIGRTGKLKIVSAPSQVMEARNTDATYCYIHTLGKMPDGSLALLPPQRIEIAGRTS